MKKRNLYVLILSFLIVFLVAFIGSIFTSFSVDSEWYYSIKPELTPPNWIFPVIWNILFFMIALSLFFSWIKANKKQKIKIAIVFGINLLLNVSWSFLFFFLKNPSLAFADLILLEFSIIAMIFTTGKIEKKSALLLIPYFLWIIFAGVLNYLIVFN
jgi:tryptophan-rich sensory protein